MTTTLLVRMALFASTALAVACAARGESPHNDPATGDKLPLVFIHGIKGAELQTKDGEVDWVTGWQALGFSTPDIALEKRFDRGVQPMGELVPGKILSTIPILPYVFEVNVYGKWLDAAESFGRAFYPFSYDWRRDNNETVAIFERFLETVAQRHGASRVDVVAHSMGGLITLAVLNRRTDLVHRVVFAGVPFPGGIGFLPDLHEGTATGFNDDIAGPDVLATFPSVYALFPRQSDAMVDASGRPLDVDFFSLDSWEQLGLGMFAPGKTPPTPADREFFSEALSRARAFRDRLIPRVFTYPQALVVASRAHPTLAKAIRGGPKSVGGWDFESAPKEEGDERVAFKNAMPPPGVTYEVVETPAEHSELLNDGAVIERIRKFLDEGDPAVSFP